MTLRRTEQPHDLAQGLDTLAPPAILSALVEGQLGALAALRPALPALQAGAEAMAAAIGNGGRLIYTAAGSSGLMGMADGLELPGTFGLSPDRTPMLFAGGPDALLRMHGSFEDDPAIALADLDRAGLTQGDALLVVSASGTTPYALAVAQGARARGVTVVGIANVAGAALLGATDIPVLIETGAEMVAGSTRMGAATAQKVALNMISVLVGIGLGHVHAGRMVNLVADNAKLVERAALIVADLAGVPDARAREALARTGGAVKPAILVARGADPDAARAALNDSGGHLGPLMG